jgi:hypothetical protein
VVVVVVLAAAGVLMAVAPFDRRMPSGLLISGSPSCPAPIVGAWRHEQRSSGWFGYAPLTSTPALGFSRSAEDSVPVAAPVEACAEAARRRLAYAGLLLAPAAVALFLRRRRLDPPTNPNPNLAT